MTLKIKSLPRRSEIMRIVGDGFNRDTSFWFSEDVKDWCRPRKKEGMQERAKLRHRKEMKQNEIKRRIAEIKQQLRGEKDDQVRHELATECLKLNQQLLGLRERTKAKMKI